MTGYNIANNISHKYLILLWKYLNAYASGLGMGPKDIDIFDMLKLSYPKRYRSALQYYTDPQQWCPHDTFLLCARQVRDITGDPGALRKCGHFVSATPILRKIKNPMRAINNLSETLHKMPYYFMALNKFIAIDVLRGPEYNANGDKLIALIRYESADTVDINDTYYDDDILLGIFEGVPTAYPASISRPWKKLPLGKARMRMVHHNPVNLYSRRFFRHLDLQPHYKDHNLFIRDPNTNKITQIGHRVTLEETEINDNKYCVGDYKVFTEDESAKKGTIITKSIKFKDEMICTAGLIMDGPYCVFDYECLPMRNPLKEWQPSLFKFSGKEERLQNQHKTNLKWAQEIKKRDKDYEELKRYNDKLENIINERTEMLNQAADSLRQMDQVVMRVVSHGLGNWSASAIADAHLIAHALDNNNPAQVEQHLSRLLSNCGVAALSAIGLNYYCKRNVIVNIDDVINFLQNRSYFSKVLNLHCKKEIKNINVNGSIYMLLSEVFQNAIKALSRQRSPQSLDMEIKYDPEADLVTFILKNKGSLQSNLLILNSERQQIPDKHQGGWICKKLAKDLDGTITWAEDNGMVIVTVQLPRIRETETCKTMNL